MILLMVVFGLGLIGSLLWAWRLYKGKTDIYDTHMAFWFLAFVFFVAFCFVAGKAQQAQTEAAMFNARYGTDYTTEQMFWARDSIRQTLEGTRQRIDVQME